ncbi:MAG: fructose-bisphosphate aldolase [Anaerolineae bacterium]|nr:MAG: fructose-bisphosphate aldolase [Anaerolineae bacterium]
MTPKRPSLDSLDHLSLGKRTRLHRLLYEHGPGHGTLLLLPIDQGLEHGPVDFFPNPPSLNPDYQCRLALEGNHSGIVFHIGLAERYMRRYAGKVPLVLKINGKTNIPSDAQALSPLTATVEDAVRLGADAIGYTLYVGSPRQDDDFLQFTEVRADCERYGMPLVVWSYPRGEAIEKKGGRDSVYAVDYAARVANELGADVVKLNVPRFEDPRNEESPKPYNTFYKELDYASAVRKVVESAGKTMVLFSGGSKIGDKDLLEKARICMEQGATGLIFGRNMWQRPFDEGLSITRKVFDIMLQAVK